MVIRTLNEYLLPFVHEYHTDGYTFQQDLAPIHTSTETKDCLMDMEILILPWVFKSPNLNLIENLWGDISRMVYANGKQY